MKTTLILLLSLVIVALPSALWARTWTNQKGQSIEADFVKVEEVDGVANVVLQKAGSTKPYIFPVTDLSEADQAHIAEAQASQEAEPVGVAKKTSVFGEVLDGKLVALEGKRLGSFEPTKDPDYFAFYFSAHWCPPCRTFTPKLVKFYDEASKGPNGDKFEIVLVSRDHGEDEMQDYMAGEKMNWPAVKFRYGDKLKEVNALAGSGIPCLVLVDREGNVVSDSYDGKTYVGPTRVMEDLAKLLK